MRIKLTLSTLLALTPLSCGEIVIPNAQDNGIYTSSQDKTANDLYLSDLEESADEELGNDVEVDDSILEDIQDQRIAEMVEMFFSQFDSDESGDLTLDEFLTRAKDRATEDGVDDERLKTRLNKLTEDFSSAAGEDELLSKEEMALLLKTAASRIGKHRHFNFQGQHEDRLRPPPRGPKMGRGHHSRPPFDPNFDMNGPGEADDIEVSE